MKFRALPPETAFEYNNGHMGSSRFGRRHFLRTSAALTGGWALSSCASMERLFGPDQGVYDDEVLIVGAGAAGLMAAYELKKKQIPYRIIEASPRLGGRVRTLHHFNGDQQFAELGAEFIDGRHETVFALCSELSLPVDALPDRLGEAGGFFVQGSQVIPRRDLLKDLQPLVSKLVRLRLQITGDEENAAQAFAAGASEDAARLDLMSTEALVDQLAQGLSPRAAAYMKRASLVQFGVEPSRQSCLHLLMSLDPEARSSGPSRVRGGMGNLTQALYERVCGVLPEFFVRFKTRLLSMRDEGGFFECRVQSPQGRQSLRARHVILALPPAALRRVEGLANLKIAAIRREAVTAMRFAHHSRTIVGFSDRFWNLRGEGPLGSGALMGDLRLQSCWDSSRGQEGRSGLITFTTAGEEGLNLGADAPELGLRDLERVWKKVSALSDKRSAVQNWSRVQGLEGSVTVYAPGQFSRFNGVFQEADYQGRLAYAGEHTSAGHHGRIEGALESGRRAAAQVIAALESAVKKG
ncbi:MAG: FAD-dependent oxidoreductase [Bdellovibrionaceae bacterium]|nr:FAD-dependent oxidoreductase [Pseudobdellovibrionaceae bacterium]